MKKCICFLLVFFVATLYSCQDSPFYTPPIEPTEIALGPDGPGVFIVRLTTKQYLQQDPQPYDYIVLIKGFVKEGRAYRETTTQTERNGKIVDTVFTTPVPNSNIVSFVHQSKIF